VLARLPGSLAASIHADETSDEDTVRVAAALRRRAGRLIMNAWPTGVAVCAAQHHGGPWPATTDAHYTSVGATAMDRWLIPVVFQNWPERLLPPELRSDNPLSVPQQVES
jgi:NADP-dependent aldehyde dehydrogenase